MTLSTFFFSIACWAVPLSASFFCIWRSGKLLKVNFAALQEDLDAITSNQNPYTPERKDWWAKQNETIANWQTATNIFNLVAFLGIVITLVYLATV